MTDERQQRLRQREAVTRELNRLRDTDEPDETDDADEPEDRDLVDAVDDEQRRERAINGEADPS